MSRQVTSNEVLASIWVAFALAFAALAHVLLWLSRYRPDQLYAGVVARVVPRGHLFSWLGPPLQWLCSGSLLLWPAFLALAVWQMSDENWRVAALGGSVAASLILGSFGAACFARDMFQPRRLSLLLFGASAVTLAGFFVLFVWVIKPFSFIGSSVTLLCASALPSIALAFLLGPWRGAVGVELCLADATTLEQVAASGLLSKRPWVLRVVATVMALTSFAILGLYGITVYRSDLDTSLRSVGLLLAAGVLVLDALVWHLWNLGLVLSATQTAFLMIVARVAACGWGERYWLLGHSCVFLAMAILLSHITMNEAFPAPDRSKMERQRLAAAMLSHLDLPVAAAGGGAPVGMHQIAARQLSCIWHPGWVYLAVVLAFAAEMASVSVTDVVALPDVSLCPTCKPRKQALYAGAALGGALLYLLSVVLVHAALRRAADRPLVQTSWPFLALVYLLWVVLSAYIAWLVGSWSVLIHTALLPLVFGMFIVGYQKFVADDYRLKQAAAAAPALDARVHPAPDAAAAADPAAAAAAPAADPAARGSAGFVQRLVRLWHWYLRTPFTVRAWSYTSALLMVYAGWLHVALDRENRWIGWSISVAVLVLILTFISNRLWFGTLRLLPEQPLLWSVIMAVLLGWAAGMWLLQLERAISPAAFAVLGVLVLYPAMYADIMAVQVARDARWSLKEKGTRNFVARAGVSTLLVYIALFGGIAYWSWGITVLGFSMLGVLGLLAVALWKWQQRGRHLSWRMIIVLDSSLAFLILVAAAGIAGYFQSIFGGFSVLCGGGVLMCSGACAFKLFEAHSETKLQRLRSTSDFVFPIYRVAGSGRLVPAQSAVLLALAALAVTACWGFVAAAVLRERPYVGAVVGVLALLAAFVLLCRLAADGGAARRALLDLPVDEKIAAVRQCLEAWQLEAGSASRAVDAVTPAPSPSPSAGPPVVGPDAVGGAAAGGPVDSQQATQALLDRTLRSLDDARRVAKELYDQSATVACSGRFSSMPFKSALYVLSAGVAKCRHGRGCLEAKSPSDPLKAHQDLRQTLNVWLEVLQRQLRFTARLQLCLMSTHAQWLWSREAEFKDFLRSTGGGTQSLSYEDFQKLDEGTRQQIHEAWELWKQKRLAEAAMEEQRRKEAEEAAKRRREEERQRRLEALAALAAVTGSGDVAALRQALDAAHSLGLDDSALEVELAEDRLQGLEDAVAALDKALATLELSDLEFAVSLAGMASLVDDRIQRAQQEIERLTAAGKAAADAKKKEEEELRKRLREEEERRKQEERKRKQEEERKRREEEERKRREEDERRRKQAEDERKRREEALAALAAATGAGDVEALRRAMEAARALGFGDGDLEIQLAATHLQGLEEAIASLDKALACGELSELEEAVTLATVALLEDDRLRQAKEEIERLAAADADARRKAEEDRVRRLKEAEERRKEEERRRLEEEDRRRRVEEEERRRKQAEDEQRRRREALEALVTATGGGDVDALRSALEAAQALGADPDGPEVKLGKDRLRGLEGAIAALIQALATGEEATLKEALAAAAAISLVDDHIQQAHEELQRLQADVGSKTKAEEARKRAEEEQRRKEEERRRKQGLKGGDADQAKIIAADIDKLKDQIKHGKFVDNTFQKAKMGGKVAKYECKRMSDMMDKVRLKEDGFQSSDINQGGLGDCWFLSAVACAAEKGKIECLFQFVDEDKGVYVVRFFKNGVYRDVVVDDVFPTIYGQMAFASSGKKHESWVQVLEKAYAKLHGSFDAICGGWVSDGLVDLTGGIGDIVNMKADKTAVHDGSLWRRLKQLNDQGHMLGCGSHAGSDADVNPSGIVQGHAYSILRVEEVDGLQLLKLRNPWGSTEWKGKWSDHDEASWNQRMKAKLQFHKKDDGEFWMAFEDFIIHYSQLYICRVFDDGWCSVRISSEWKGRSAGGCRNYDTFQNNPIFRLSVKGRVKLMIVLSQQDSRGRAAGGSHPCINVQILKAGASGPGCDRVATSGSYANRRQVVLEEEVSEPDKSPHYVIASTFDPHEENTFSLQVLWQGADDLVKFYKESDGAK